MELLPAPVPLFLFLLYASSFSLFCFFSLCAFPQGSLDKPTAIQPLLFLPRKEVIQPHLPIRLPCYDFTPVIRPAFDGSLPHHQARPGVSFLSGITELRSVISLLLYVVPADEGWVTGFGHFRLPWCDGRCVQDPGTYSPQHADLRLLAIPASCSRVADYNPN